MSILEGELAETIADALIEASVPVAVVVTRNEVSGPVWEPIITPVAHDCQGLTVRYTVLERAHSNVEVSDVKVLILASTLDIEPNSSNIVTIGGTTFSIIAFSTDPARALWVFQSRV